jgi:hypothetical protein
MAIDADRIEAGELIRVRVSFERQHGTLVYSVRPEWIAQSNSPDPNDPVEPPVENQPPTSRDRG